MDPSTLFAMIFGSEKFVPLVGEYICVYCVVAYVAVCEYGCCIMILLESDGPSDTYSNAIIFNTQSLFTGELKLASQMQAEESEASNPKLKKFRQKKREVQCAVNLVQKVQPFLDNGGDEEVRSAAVSVLC